MYFRRGDEFRREFSLLGELRSLLPRHVHIMAMTATAYGGTLGMKETVESNVIYSVLSFKCMETVQQHDSQVERGTDKNA